MLVSVGAHTFRRPFQKAASHIEDAAFRTFAQIAQSTKSWCARREEVDGNRWNFERSVVRSRGQIGCSWARTKIIRTTREDQQVRGR